MISTQTRRASALAAGVALIGATLTAMPAQAAPGDLSFIPTVGSSGNYNVFNSDTFALTTAVNTIAVGDTSTLAYKIEMDSDEDNTGIVVSFDGSSAPTLDVTRYSAAGEELTSQSFAATNEDLYIDFFGNSAASKAGYVIISDVNNGNSGGETPTFEIVQDGQDSANLTGASTSDTTRAEFGDGDSAITVTAWLDLNSDTSDIEETYSTGPQEINFFDPANVSVRSSIARMTATGAASLSDTDIDPVQRQDFTMDVAGVNASEVTGRMSFNKPVNFAQIDLTQWKIGTSGTVTDDAMRAIAVRDLDVAGQDKLDDSESNFEILTASNGKPAEANGELLFRVFHGADPVVAGDKMQLDFSHIDGDASTYSSPQFTFVQKDHTATSVEVTASPTEFSSDISGDALTLSAGVSDFTYSAQAQLGSDDVETANIPMIARVEATSFLPSGEVISVSGTSQKIDQSGEAVYVSGVTNSDGQFSVTVSAGTAAAGTDYNIQFYMQDEDNLGNWVAANEITATYGVTEVASDGFKAVNEVSSAASPVLEFTVEDAFGEGVSTDATGKQYSVMLTAPDTDDLEQYAPVAADGTVSFTFDTWLSTGESELLTAELYTGTSTSPSSSDMTGKQATVTLFAPVASNAITLNRDEIDGMTVEYNDFITGKKDKVGPVTGKEETVTGTVTDSNGSGIPGTPVTLEAEGVQFLTGSTYSIGSVDLVTDAAGSFSADIWVQEVSGAGITLTATTGTLSDTALIKSGLPASDATNRGNLVFSVDMPDNVVVNTTYAVTATLTDVFGNPVPNATVNFDGFGAAEFNGKDSAERTTNRNGEAVAFLRSIKDVDGLSAIEISVTAVDHDADGEEDIASISSSVATDVETTSWDESAWSNTFETQVNFLASAADTPSADQKVNAGSFKGYVALYAKGYEGQRMSAIVAGKWLQVDSLASNFERVVRFTGAGYDIKVRIYIDGEQVGPEFNILTK